MVAFPTLYWQVVLFALTLIHSVFLVSRIAALGDLFGDVLDAGHIHHVLGSAQHRTPAVKSLVRYIRNFLQAALTKMITSRCAGSPVR